jgi:hypothetical protein
LLSCLDMSLPRLTCVVAVMSAITSTPTRSLSVLNLAKTRQSSLSDMNERIVLEAVLNMCQHKFGLLQISL